MKCIIEYFDRAYIINLADRKDRRHETEEEFKKIGLNIPNERVLFHTVNRPTERGGFATVGLRGCFSSHKQILEIAISDSLRNVLIFEDDISFRSIPETFDQKLIDRLDHEDWDIVRLGYCAPSARGLVGPLLAWDGNPLGTHFYAVNGRFMTRLFQYMCECESRPRGHPDGGCMGADATLNHMQFLNRDVRLFLSVPNLAHQRSSRTDVHSHQQKWLVSSLDRIALLAPLSRASRRMRHNMRMSLDKAKLREIR